MMRIAIAADYVWVELKAQLTAVLMVSELQERICVWLDLCIVVWLCGDRKRVRIPQDFEY
jgi:hypothetical protein